MRLFPSMKSIAVIAGLLALMGWAYMNDVFVTGTDAPLPEANVSYVPAGPSTTGSDAPPQHHQVRQVDTQHFAAEVYGVPGTVLVDFTAAWCEPCQQQARVLQQFAWNDGSIKVVQVDVDRNRELARQFRITTVPTLVVMRDARELRRHVGLADQATIRTLVH